METFTKIEDLGHGWLAVPLEAAVAVGLDRSSFTGYSYFNNGVLYLEEDCDFAIFYAAYHKANGKLPTVAKQYVKGSWVGRNYATCTGQSAGWTAAFAYLDSVKAFA